MLHFPEAESELRRVAVASLRPDVVAISSHSSLSLEEQSLVLAGDFNTKPEDGRTACNAVCAAHASKSRDRQFQDSELQVLTEGALSESDVPQREQVTLSPSL